MWIDTNGTVIDSYSLEMRVEDDTNNVQIGSISSTNKIVCQGEIVTTILQKLDSANVCPGKTEQCGATK